MLQPPSTPIFTVSRLNSTVRKLLEMEMGQIWLSAEISNFSQPSSSHWYFTLKDDSAQVRCAMFRNTNRHVTFRPQNGQQVLVRATITLYEPRGDYQLIAESMQPAGEGALRQQFEQLKHRLQAEGLFEQARKQALPQPARQVGVITSATGAALHDVLRVLQRRDPSLPVVIYPTLVQGAEAPDAIANAIDVANRRNECDVLIVGRGGGSLEDLWCFNDERVARSIYASRIPIISAVGHETDVTISDFVADLRAPTPSAAAELVSRNQVELLRQLQSQQTRLEMAADYYLAEQNRTFTRLHHRLQQQHPQLRLVRQQTAMIKLQRRLADVMLLQLRQAVRRQESIGQRLLGLQPQRKIHRAQQHLQQILYRLQQSLQQHINHDKQRFSALVASLEGVSPLATLARGFSVTTAPDGKVLKNIRQIQPGDKLKTRLDDGWVESGITAITPVKKREKYTPLPDAHSQLFRNTV
ncbi:exodeoxyribonuclease VII large subunit [Erwinia tracheiphila]|uniref:Exodeoxyribonuclease 7 large subunit n=1 Tax=Erwinia tracheiphila TaxID=65700 RepID=A0A345CZ11_9GAMM|nr:exodeoxyribonuclease VII large subunit [Erwinia tracheiphila]AXF78678.1 exodeoxyribonuclease VII large subunit [Erwinia tracheiphila]UIA82454.1 exodeoxyribonuclease VII large subunit [Erwinia tracheiphila]UIA89291.1 exodeoxyribonuclease VII large subunit [Erwinia tracheiphila]UIA91043.1 exodeoxyribonuclease VII large subunit [Erwinia tracheiphila]